MTAIIHSSRKPNQENQNSEPVKKQEPESTNKFVYGLGIVIGICAMGILLSELAVLIKEVVNERIWRSNPEELERNASTKFSTNFLKKIKQIKGIDYIRLFKRLVLCNEEEKEILKNLEDKFHISEDHLKEILMGGHVRLDDDGEMYQEWHQKIESKNARISSHPSDKQQFSVQGPLVKELLFSRVTESDGKTYTWFQLENHPVSLGHIIRHMMDYFKYKLNKENQGPYGSSKATHYTPIMLNRKLVE